ncbi:hypothetical protein KUCAC02_033019 [Chaenocephalus aceratus]|nr:hypothetical protein KUCAC02_033019 [Chaenocephalus aceratus]
MSGPLGGCSEASSEWIAVVRLSPEGAYIHTVSESLRLCCQGQANESGGTAHCAGERLSSIRHATTRLHGGDVRPLRLSRVTVRRTQVSFSGFVDFVACHSVGSGSAQVLQFPHVL